MAGVNKVILLGNLGRDPELRYTQGGQAVANFTVATSETWNDKNGEKSERTEWHRVVVWGKTAELCSQYLSKGRSVYLEGRIQTREWEDKEGQKRYTTEVTAQTVQFLGSGRNENSAAANVEDTPSAGAPPSSQGGEPRGPVNEVPPEPGDDIPF